MASIRIESGGTAYNTTVYVGGVPVTENVRAVEWRVEGQQMATAVITFENVEVDVTGLDLTAPEAAER